MSNPLRSSDVIHRLPAQVAALPDGRVLTRGPSGVSLLGGVDLVDLQGVLDRIDGRRSAGEICADVADEYEVEEVLDLLRHTDGSLVAVGEPAEDPKTPADREAGPRLDAPSRALVLGDGVAGRRLADLLAAPRLAGPPAAEGLDRLRGLDLVVCALEDTAYGTLFDIQQACRRAAVVSLFVTVDPDGVRLGPSVVPGTGPCFGCAQGPSFRIPGLAIADLVAAVGGFRTGRIDATRFEPAAREAAREARAILRARGAPATPPALLGSVLLLSREGRRRTYLVPPVAGCPLCRPDPGREHALALEVEQQLIDSYRREPRRAAMADGEGLCTSVGIIGGGTAGYLTALALRRRWPSLAVALIESSDVPIIGVGEATTPLMPQFLHNDLGLDVHELFREVYPTLKLGIRFEWGQPGADFNYPFGPVHVLEPAVYDGDILGCSPQSLLMATGAVPIVRGGGSDAGLWRSSLGVDTAYHLDNARFVAYLRRKTGEVGIEAIDARIVGVDVAEDGESVAGLKADDDRVFIFDLYVDCTGFHSLLLERGLGSPFKSYETSLFTDRALVATVPHGGEVRPYTSAKTLSSGWCWSTPQRHEDHRGYVFCSAFASPEAAEREMRRYYPDLIDPRLIEFRAGRHEHFWRGNVVAMGNAYGFVEPLESTALHMLIRQIGLLLGAFPLRIGERGVTALLNHKVGTYWDYLCWFLAIHYRFNRRLDTPFWRHCRHEVDVSAHGELIEAFRERGPLAYQPAIRNGFAYPDPLWGAEGIDVILMGQQLSTCLPRPRIDRQQWQQRAALYRRYAERAMPQAKALAAIEEHPEILDPWAQALRRFGPAFQTDPGR